ncbi:MAG: hypothetical protein AAF702_22405 [Chloroflexota bacterium]
MANQQVGTTLQNFSPQQLRERCGQRQSDNSHEQFCFELFHRAIVEKSEQCWSAIYQQYHQLIYGWLKSYVDNQPSLRHIVIDEIVQTVFMNFWRAYTAEKLAKANGMASVMRYLKTCAGTAILQEIRKSKREKNQVGSVLPIDESEFVSIPSSHSTERTVHQRLDEKQIWEIVDGICHDERDQVIARLSLVSNLKPKFILEKHPDLFKDVKEIYTRRQNLKERLERDTALYGMWEAGQL